MTATSTMALLLMLLLACNFLQLQAFVNHNFCRIKSIQQSGNFAKATLKTPFIQSPNYSNAIARRNRLQPLHDILGLGPTEIVLVLVAGLVLFGPETLKSLSKDVGRAAAELKEIPKTFKEGMEEGAETSQVAKMKAIAAEKRKKRDEKKKSKDEDEDDDEDEEETA